LFSKNNPTNFYKVLLSTIEDNVGGTYTDIDEWLEWLKLWIDITPVDPEAPEVKPPQWVSVDYYKYEVGTQVYDLGKVWEAINKTHTWIQPALEGNGAISWKFVKDWAE
jgi:hypothetical protein